MARAGRFSMDRVWGSMNNNSAQYNRSRWTHRRLLTTLMMSTALCLGTVPTAFPVSQAAAQTANTHSLDIPSQPLNAALRALADQTGIQIAYQTSIAAQATAPALSGTMPTEQALGRLLSGTNLSYQFTAANTVTITDRVSAAHAPVNADGSLMLDVIDITAGGGASIYSPYETAAPTAHISAENIERFRGSSPADIFRGTPGVMSGEARNGAGAIDVNIRGMQGMGRVAVTVDGAENSLQIYQGYQGISNRTFVDPDLLAGVDVTKGSDVTSFGVAGNVAMRTLEASDIVEEGKRFGLRLKGGFGTNTSTPQAGNRAGYAWPNTPIATPIATPSPDGMARPGFLTPTSGSGSVVAAMKEENFDFLAGYAYRKQGNYHAGRHGPSANPVNVGPQSICGTYVCTGWPEYIENEGIANYRAGEEVLNTQLETQSWLLKGNMRFGDGHSLQLGYTGFRSEAGDRLASTLSGERSQAIQQEQTVGTKLDTGTLRYRWNPAENDLVDLKANVWISNLELRNQPRNAYGRSPASLGLADDFRTGSDTLMWGAETTNESALSLGHGSLDLTYGLSYRSEDTRPSAYTPEIEGWLNLRDGKRDEAAAFAKAAYKPLDWLTVNAGLRYSHYWTQDRGEGNSALQNNPKPNRNEGGLSPSLGVTVEPFDGTQFYVNYSSALRFPSLFESATAFTIIPNPDLRPERSSNWEIGTNLRRDGLVTGNDSGMLKFGYFNWDVTNYIARSWTAFPQPSGSTFWGMQVHNIDRARFSGLEMSARYENGGFAAELSANYYLSVEFCQAAGVCENKSMYGDYATNHVPPKYSVDLTLSQKLLQDRLMVGGRVSHVGPRAIGHGQVTSQGASQFISLVDWKPYTLVDVFAEYKLTENFTASARIENLFDRFYVDPLSLVQQPGPGRSFYASLTAKF